MFIPLHTHAFLCLDVRTIEAYFSDVELSVIGDSRDLATRNPMLDSRFVDI